MVDVVHNTIVHLRTEVHMTQQALAQKVGVTRQTIIAMEKGNYTPSVLLALKVAQVFDKKVEEVFYIQQV